MAAVNAGFCRRAMFEELVGEEDARKRGRRAPCASGAGRTRSSPDDDPPGLPLCCYALTAVSIRIHTPNEPARSSAHSRIALRLPPDGQLAVHLQVVVPDQVPAPHALSVVAGASCCRQRVGPPSAPDIKTPP
jgi:hypothetical protein